jgi:hypothetical protein
MTSMVHFIAIFAALSGSGARQRFYLNRRSLTAPTVFSQQL